MPEKLPRNDEALKAVAARARKAYDLIDSGRVDQGKRVLAQLIKVLPKPDMKHLRAAQNGG